jgi:hypothetical protein
MWGCCLTSMGFIAPYSLTVSGRVQDVMMAGNARGSRVVDPWSTGPFAWFSGLFRYMQVGKLNVTA